jgi:uncharacterized protein
LDLTLDRHGDYHFIRSFSDGGIMVADTVYRESIIISASSLIERWPATSVSGLEDKHLELVFELNPEVVILGTGNKQEFLPPRMMVSFYERGSGVEVMTTDAACRTYNVLVSEGRKVVAALMLDGDGD